MLMVLASPIYACRCCVQSKNAWVNKSNKESKFNRPLNDHQANSKCVSGVSLFGDIALCSPPSTQY